MKRREIQKMINNIIVLFWNKLEYKREKRIVFESWKFSFWTCFVVA